MATEKKIKNHPKIEPFDIKKSFWWLDFSLTDTFPLQAKKRLKNK
jgi:hypothetical protein